MPRRKSDTATRRQRPAVLRQLGAQVRRLRLERKLSQDRLAELAHLSLNHVGSIERGTTDPGALALIRLARALGVTVGDLFDTVTPAKKGAHRISPADEDDIKVALTTLTGLIERVMSGQPPPLPARAPRRSRR